MLDLSIQKKLCENYLFVYFFTTVPATWVKRVRWVEEND